MKVRFLHATDAFRQLYSGNQPVFDVELGAVPQVGHVVEFPMWYYDCACVVFEIRWMLHDVVPADVVCVVEDWNG